jgi:16S rRNA (cytidine1402-2'-O)-methyltransferase
MTMPDTARLGTLILVPNTLDLGEAEPADIRDVLPDGALREAARLVHWVAEDARSARAFLKRVQAVHPLTRPLQEIEIRELPRPAKGGKEPSRMAPATGPKGVHTPSPGQQGPRGSGTQEPWPALLAPALAGHDIGLISEAGLPAVADPGAALVATAHAHHVPVRVLPGPSALLLALAASGLNGQNFAFVGYLPQDAAARSARIRELEAHSRKLGQAQLFIETPYRNEALLAALLATLAPATRLSVSAGLTLPGAFTRSGTVAEWRARPASLPPKVPAVFAIQA